jgi:hypothetical protein
MLTLNELFYYIICNNVLNSNKINHKKYSQRHFVTKNIVALYENMTFRTYALEIM